MVYRKVTTKLAALAAMALLCCSTIFISTGARAQTWPACTVACPTDAPPLSIPFTGPFSLITTITFPDGTKCTVKICYCTRQTSTGNDDYTITEIMGLQSCIGSESLSDIIDQSFAALLENNPAAWPCPPCPNTGTYWQEVKATCFSQTTDPNTGITVIEFCATHGWCDTPMFVCCDPTTGAKHWTEGTTVDLNASCDKNANPPCNHLECTTPGLPH